MNIERIPDPVTEQERWIAKHRVDSIRVEYRQTGTDTAETFVTLTDGKEKVTWVGSTFRKVARLELGYNTLATANYGVAERVAARDKWEEANARELAEYKRLRAKFEKGAPDGSG